MIIVCHSKWYPDAAKGVVGLSDVIIITLLGELCYNNSYVRV